MERENILKDNMNKSNTPKWGCWLQTTRTFFPVFFSFFANYFLLQTSILFVCWFRFFLYEYNLHLYILKSYSGNLRVLCCNIYVLIICSGGNQNKSKKSYNSKGKSFRCKTCLAFDMQIKRYMKMKYTLYIQWVRGPLLSALLCFVTFFFQFWTQKDQLNRIKGTT